MEHHVYFWLNEENKSEEDRARFEKGLAALFAIDRVEGGCWSVPAAVEQRPVVDQSWDYALSMRFHTLDDQFVYQDHPDHHAFIDEFKPFWAKVLVMDLA